METQNFDYDHNAGLLGLFSLKQALEVVRRA